MLGNQCLFRNLFLFIKQNLTPQQPQPQPQPQQRILTKKSQLKLVPQASICHPQTKNKVSHFRGFCSHNSSSSRRYIWTILYRQILWITQISSKDDPVDCRVYVHYQQRIVCRFLHLRCNSRLCRRPDNCRPSDVAQLQAPEMLLCPASSLSHNWLFWI